VKNSVQAPKETADYSDFGADSVEEFGAVLRREAAGFDDAGVG
jgi:hypothetical protein